MANNNFPCKAALEARQIRYKNGTRVELVSMSDPYTTLKPGDRGTVLAVDDIGTVHIDWDCGSCLGAAYGADCIKIVPTIPETVRREILAVRATAKTNMFDWQTVLQIAEQCEFDRLVAWLPDNKKLYSHFILTGETETRE